MTWSYSRIEAVVNDGKIIVKYFVAEDKQPWKEDLFTLEGFKKFKKTINDVSLLGTTGEAGSAQV